MLDFLTFFLHLLMRFDTRWECVRLHFLYLLFLHIAELSLEELDALKDCQTFFAFRRFTFLRFAFLRFAFMRFAGVLTKLFAFWRACWLLDLIEFVDVLHINLYLFYYIIVVFALTPPVGTDVAADGLLISNGILGRVALVALD